MPTTVPELLSQTFTLVSEEGVEIMIPLYALMTWSAGFRSTLTSGSGELKVQLDDKSVTLQQFKQLIDEQTFTPAETKDFPPFEQVLALLRFLDKFECDLGMRFALETVRDKVEQKEWPPLLLVVAGAFLDRPELCKQAYDAPAYTWADYPSDMHPKGLNSAYKYQYCLLPGIMPYHLVKAMPLEYALALHTTATPHALADSELGQSDLFGHSFQRAFEITKQRVAFARAAGTMQ